MQLDQCHTIGTDRYCEWSKPNRLCNFCERLSIFTTKELLEGAFRRRCPVCKNTDIAAHLP